MKKKIISRIILVIFAGFLGFNTKISINEQTIDTSLNNLETVAMAQDEWAGWVKGKVIGDVKIPDRDIFGVIIYRYIRCCINSSDNNACNAEVQDYECYSL
ncbi:MAG: hypothetical protein KH586_05430 [Tannerella sp.]|nr:hypothetical protein [Tannerella sp.]